LPGRFAAPSLDLAARLERGLLVHLREDEPFAGERPSRQTRVDGPVKRRPEARQFLPDRHRAERPTTAQPDLRPAVDVTLEVRWRKPVEPEVRPQGRDEVLEVGACGLERARLDAAVAMSREVALAKLPERDRWRDRRQSVCGRRSAVAPDEAEDIVFRRDREQALLDTQENPFDGRRSELGLAAGDLADREAVPAIAVAEEDSVAAVSELEPRMGVTLRRRAT
jgi:hypothetical protein